MVDHVEFVDSATVDRFIDRWRVTSHQALAWLIGTYDFYAGVPLGVKGKVRYLWMPLQETAQDGIELPTDTSPLYGALETLLHNTLAWLGLEKIGAIWTDLSPAGVPPCRGPETYFVSSWEIAWITQMQLAHPIPGCFEASSASRWISIVVTADVNGEVALFPYQVSLQATSLAKAELLHPTSEASSCAIWAPKNGHFSSVPLPELFYRVEEVQDTEEGNARANPAQRRADPCFPSEYLLVSLTHGFLADKMQPCNHFDIAATFVAAAGEICSSTFLCALAPFLLHHDSGDESMTGLMRQIHADLGKLSVFTLGLLVALHGMNIFTSEELTLLKDHSDAFFDTSGWRDLKERMKAARADAGSIDMQANDAPLWACTFCTLINPVSVDDCEACGLPRSPA
ncbi:hypothetical protein DI09_6p30 [Mitosporidium daphniae]|uniref:RanBP2-type domain-containing protein n=1 Tax=Mitosporidium daphniae TaxID=1485682 RepID=A0A098VNS1_9MICR|nr:uncharacterized protein DI09_6p30 [Mitosporidium daphniae]KGG50419.1 hypothetical protein DI09_6p30 [Mitosporidium daphniae]|eukprot:XP_013236906.1 uncharacterized protein DI09_6p30 [Mitosporidium daphniae]